MNTVSKGIIEIKGIGEETALSLNEMGIYTIDQLLEYFPFSRIHCACLDSYTCLVNRGERRADREQ